MTFEPSIEKELFDNGQETRLRTHTRLREETGGPHWWHVYQAQGDGLSATIVLKQGVPDPPQLTPELFLKLSGMDLEGDPAAMDILEAFDGADVVLLASFDRQPDDDEVAALTGSEAG